MFNVRCHSAMLVCAHSPPQAMPALLTSTSARYGQDVGFAFQIQDDVLDVLGDTEVIGKPQGSDSARGKPTYPALVGIDESRRLASLHRDFAIEALAGFDQRADVLRALARYVVDRES